MNLREPTTSGLACLLVLALIAAGCTKESEERQVTSRRGPEPAETAQGGPGFGRGPDAQPKAAGRLPRLVDLGRGTCIPCKMMAPILQEIKEEYKGKAAVEVIDLREDGEAASEYGVRIIPTQIFFDAEGREVWRHEGFLAKDAIIAKFTEMGVRPLDN